MEIEKTRMNGNIKLTDLVHVLTTMKGSDGQDKEVIIIPLEKNRLSKDTKDNVYLNFWGKFSPKLNNATHWIKQSIKKEEMEKLSEEEKKAIPFLGNLTMKEDVYQDAPNVADAGIGTAPPAFEPSLDSKIPF